jgi:hypothetical protein
MKSDQIEDLITPAEAARMRGVTRSFLYRKEVMSFTPEITGRPPKAKTESTSKRSKKGGKR